jgi:hypothetical protein
LNPGFASGREKLLDPTVPEALDHAYSVARHYSPVQRMSLWAVGYLEQNLPSGAKAHL